MCPIIPATGANIITTATLLCLFTENVDYAAVATTLTFSSLGTQCFDVTIIDDNIPNEGPETFRLVLSVPSFPALSDDLIVTIASDVGGA